MFASQQKETGTPPSYFTVMRKVHLYPFRLNVGVYRGNIMKIVIYHLFISLRHTTGLVLSC